MGKWKIVVLAKDTPGFIVNKVARPFYGEALKIYESGIADFATIATFLLKFHGSFKNDNRFNHFCWNLTDYSRMIIDLLIFVEISRIIQEW